MHSLIYSIVIYKYEKIVHSLKNGISCSLVFGNTGFVKTLFKAACHDNKIEIPTIRFYIF